MQLHNYDINNLFWKINQNSYDLKGEIYPFSFDLNVNVFPFFLKVWKWEYKNIDIIAREEFDSMAAVWEYIFELIQRPESSEKVLPISCMSILMLNLC
jgi:Sec7-like guanine-nucleotide exchange factor